MSVTPRLADGRPLRPRWDWYLVVGVSAVLGSAAIVDNAVRTVHDLFGGAASWFGIIVASACLGIGFAVSARRATTWIAALPAVAFPAVTWGWCRVALQMPGSAFAKSAVDAYGESVGPVYAELGPTGVAIVMTSMAAVVAMFWALGDRRVGWWLRIPVVIAVVGTHVLIVLWLMGRPLAA